MNTSRAECESTDNDDDTPIMTFEVSVVYPINSGTCMNASSFQFFRIISEHWWTKILLSLFDSSFG